MAMCKIHLPRHPKALYPLSSSSLSLLYCLLSRLVSSGPTNPKMSQSQLSSQQSGSLLTLSRLPVMPQRILCWYTDVLHREAGLARVETPSLTPSFWRPYQASSRTHTERLLPPPPTGKVALFVWAISVVHADIHLIGWRLSFPTESEAWIWRISSVTLLIVMIIGGALPVLSTREWFDFSFNVLWIWVRPARKNTWVRRHVFDFVVDFAYFVYIIARLLIVADIFMSFRSLPETAYSNVSWTNSLPHID